MTRRACNRCGRRRVKLKASKTDPSNMLCGSCWDKLGGSRAPVSNRDAARRRARGDR